MKMKFTLEDIFSIPTAVIYYPDKFKTVTSVSIDTRTIKKNSLFVAIKGTKFDGHNYINDAIKKGAKAIIVSNRKLNQLDDVKIPIISVKNTIDAYAYLASICRNRLSAKVISITGSNGKTSTKEILAHLLSAKYKVHKTYSNNNNHIGVPLTILSTPENTDYLILEHGTNHFGEIEYTAKVAQPDFALITNIGNSHTKFLQSKEKVLSEKKELFNYLKSDGTIFINSDDDLLKSIKNDYKNKVSFGFKGRTDIKAKKVIKNKLDQLEISGLGKEIKVSIPLLGDSNQRNYLAAVSIALKCGLNKNDTIKATKSLTPISGRLEEISKGYFSVINDTYNSNPESVISALDVLNQYKKYSKKIVIIGDMLELGKQTISKHSEIAKYIDSINADKLYTIGKNARIIFENSKNVATKKHFSNRSALVNFLNKMDASGTVILVKGSRGMKMEEFVEVLSNKES